ncbi:MAG TPA: hypothetical protein VE226_04305 [Nitrososphaeraceae archaeon]|nr:hypothetical protein [Nitrososphaeraceae archaeon]
MMELKDIDMSSPLSWIYETNFMLSYSGSSIHMMRYKDIHERMELIYPYFIYEFSFETSDNNFNIKKIAVISVIDDKNTYWLRPFIVLLDTAYAPWSSGNLLKLVGYAVIDGYDGSGRLLIINGKDAFSQIFLEQYKDNNIVNSGLSLAKPAIISAPLTFNEADTRYLFDSDFAHTKRIISKFLKDFGSWSGERIFEWESNNNKVNYGIMKEANGIAENHYVSIEVDSNN